MITACFPPTDRVAGFRAAEFVKYLREYGWTPYVLTRNKKDQIDRPNEIPAAINNAENIIRCKDFVNLFDENNMGEVLGISWTPNLIREARAIISKYDIDVVFHTGGPFSPMLGTLLLHKFLDVPYVLDLRDPWSLRMDYSEPTGILSRMYRANTSLLEPLIFNNSETIIMNTEVMEKEYEKKYPELTTKFKTITNGFDDDRYQPSRSNTNKEGFQIVYPGKFYGDLQPLFRALATFFEHNPGSRFVHLGNPDTQAQHLVEELECEENVEFRGYVSRDEVVDTLQRSDLGLALGRDITHVPMKVYDYMGCNLPTFALGTPNSALLDLIEEFNGGYTADRTNTEHIESTLHNIYDIYPDSLSDPKELEPYKFESLTMKLAEVFEESTQSN